MCCGGTVFDIAPRSCFAALPSWKTDSSLVVAWAGHATYGTYLIWVAGLSGTTLPATTRSSGPLVVFWASWCSWYVLSAVGADLGAVAG
jgi:hypothetical protein